MLTITREAADLLADARESTGAPDDYGVRLFARTPQEGGDPELAMTFVPDAAPGDVVTEQEGMKAYVAPEVKEALDEATLDASPVDGTPQLVLRR